MSVTSTMTIGAANAVHDAAQALVDTAQLRPPADVAHAMDTLARTMQHFCDFGRHAARECQDRMQDADASATKNSYDYLATLFASLPKRANKTERNFLEACSTLHDLEELTPRPKSSPQPAAMVVSAAAMQTAVFALTRAAGLPTVSTGQKTMTLLADTMQHIRVLAEKLDSKSRIAARNAITADIAREYEWLSRSFTALRHHANETRAVFLNAADGFDRLWTARTRNPGSKS